jgi:hypothetical protein
MTTTPAQLRRILNEKGCKNIKISTKRDITGWAISPSGQAYYFMVSDLDGVCYRTAPAVGNFHMHGHNNWVDHGELDKIKLN